MSCTEPIGETAFHAQAASKWHQFGHIRTSSESTLLKSHAGRGLNDGDLFPEEPAVHVRLIDSTPQAKHLSVVEAIV